MVISRRCAVTGALVLLCTIAVASETLAQGFFQSLFGFGTPPATQQPSRPAPPPGYGYREPVRPPYAPPPVDRPSDQSSSGRFRTVCVRLCDGYYYPLSAAASRRDLRRDALSCKASCGTEARLFYQSSGASDAAGLVDLTGLAYSRLPNAFRYRKTLVDGCKCKPDPWAASELDRHRAYALAEQAMNTPDKMASGTPSAPVTPVPAEVVAGAPTRDETRLVQAATVTTDTTDVSPPPVSRPSSRASTPPPARLPQRPTHRVAGQMQKPAKTSPKVSPKPPAPFSGMFGSGGSTLRWPGD
jgi:hypothetical protein